MRPFPPSTTLPHFCVRETSRHDSGLGAGCEGRGAEVLEALRTEVQRSGAGGAIWITESKCLGMCPRKGAGLAVYPSGELYTQVVPSDVPTILQNAFGRVRKT